MRRPLSSPRRLFGFAMAGIVGMIVLLGVLMVGFGYFDRTTETVTVFDKERVCDSSSSDGTRTCRYLVFTSGTTYQLSDSLFAGRWSSSDAYGRIRRCHQYEIESYGWRLPLFSQYPNIVEMRDLGIDETCDE